jgi:hypothetical protein
MSVNHEWFRRFIYAVQHFKTRAENRISFSGDLIAFSALFSTPLRVIFDQNPQG